MERLSWGGTEASIHQPQEGAQKGTLQSQSSPQSPQLHLTAGQTLAQTPQLSHSETQKLWHNPFQFCFNPLNAGVICSAAVDNCVHIKYFIFIMWK